MSAPPENRTNPQPRFVSSINIPMNMQPDGNSQQQQQQQAQNQQQQQPPQQQPQGSKTTERVIPIMVEGRDVPIVPKNTNQSNATAPPPQPSDR